MRKSIVTFVLGKVKNDKEFENRLCDVMTHGLSGESALETLILGYPAELKSVNNDKAFDVLKARYPNACKLKSVRLLDNTQICVEYEREVTRYFRTEQDAERAVKNGSYCSGNCSKSDEYPFEARIIDPNNSANFVIDEMRDAVSVKRL